MSWGIPGKLASVGWMVSRDLQDLWELRGGRGSKASREMLAPRALLECRDWELHRGRLERKATKERRARRGCWASLVSVVLQDPPEPGDALVRQVCKALPGSMVLKE